MRTTAARKAEEARFADACKVLWKWKPWRPRSGRWVPFIPGYMKKIICFETVRFSALFLQMQTLFSERADEAVDMRDADRDTMLHMWNYTLCTDMRWWELFSKSTSWLSAARLEGRVGREVESERQTGTVSPRPRDLGQAVTSSTRQGWRSFPGDSNESI